MTDKNSNPSIEGLEEAIEQARAEARAAGHAEGYSAGRADAAAILAHENAVGRTEAAVELAGDAGITNARAISLLAKMPQEKKDSTASFGQLMQGRAPDLGNGVPEPTEAEARAHRVAELQSIAKSASPRR